MMALVRGRVLPSPTVGFLRWLGAWTVRLGRSSCGLPQRHRTTADMIVTSITAALQFSLDTHISNSS